MKNLIVSAIDVGTSKVCSIIASAGDGNAPRILGVGVVPSKGMVKGLVSDMDEMKECIRSSVRKAERGCGLPMETAYVGVSGRHINSINNKGMVAIARGDKKVKSDDLKRVMDDASGIEVPSDRRVLHVIPRKYVLDGQAGVETPVGMHGLRLDVEAHIITAQVASVQNLVKCVRGAGVEVEETVVEPLAAAEAVLTDDEREAGVILADIGAGTTDIVIYKDGTVWHTAVLPVGGTQVTRDIAIGLGIPFEVAEDMKKKYGNLLASAIVNNEELKEVKVDGDGQAVMQRDLCDIMRARIEELLHLVQIELPKSECTSLLPAGMVLTGGVANTPGMENLAQEVLRMPARIGAPRGMYGLAEVLYDPACSCGVGLLRWGLRERSSHPGKESISKRIVDPIRSLFQDRR